ncbi:MAG TPA: sigma factor [Bryobacteraceae bacterium]|jgi:RNA polymerase sigma factor (sigma-70 family)|nr:sigma factor [Bryobacteraceae bacterium]
MRVIECRVRTLIGRYGIEPGDRGDLTQQLFLEYLERAGGFDPSRGRYKTFVNCVVRNRVVSLIRARKRRYNEATLCALPPLSAEDSDDLNGDLSEDAIRMLLGLASRPAAELLDLRLDVDRAFRSLPPDLRAIGVRVVEEGVSAVSNSLGRSPARIYQLLWSMRPWFAGLGAAPTANPARESEAA